MKKTFIKILCLTCAVLTLSSTFTACQQNENEQTESTATIHTVTFNSNGGTSVRNAEVPHEQTVSEPIAPTREGHIFYRWLHNGDIWLFHHKKITSDITLDAEWLPAHKVLTTVPSDTSGELLISGFINEMQKNLEVLAIPEIINGNTIVGFTDGAFEKLSDAYAHKIIIPKTVKTIGAKAFAEIQSVHVEFTGPISKLSEYSFYKCAHLEEITFEKGLTEVPAYCFYGAAELKTIELPEGLTVIEENAFEKCSSLKTLFLPSTLQEIKNMAFEDIGKLEVIYNGTKEDFDKINIAANNDDLLNAKIYFYSETKPTGEGNFWHYSKNNTPTPW